MDLTTVLASEPLALAMKAVTFAGVAAAASGVALGRMGPRARVRCFAVGLAGVALMFANALLPLEPLSVAVDAGYALLAAATVRRGLREGEGLEGRAPPGPPPALAPHA